jgi:hypothetical protein
MSWSRSSRERLSRLFLEGFSVMDIAEPLVSFDADKPAGEVRALMEERGFGLVGVRDEGLVCGYAKREELSSGCCGDHLHGFVTDDIVRDSASLAKAIASLAVNDRCFVTVLDRVAAVVTHEDLEKPPVRMFLFGMLTIAEVLLTRAVRERFPDGGWKSHISVGRLQKAVELQTERQRRNQRVDLVDCLQFADKGEILVRDEQYRQEMDFASRKEGLRALKELETLRNHLAHSQEIIPTSWNRIVRITSNLGKLLDRL